MIPDGAPMPAAPYGERIIVNVPPQGRGCALWFGLLFLGFMMVVGLLFTLGAIGLVANAVETGSKQVTEEHHSLSKSGTDKIAIITVEGAILDGDGFVKKQIDHVRDDPHVRAIVLRVNSPGGTMTASDYLYHHLQKLAEDRKLPIVVSMGGLAASGGYYVSMAVGSEKDAIFAEPTTWTGSIGVIIPHYNVAGLMKSWEIEEDSIKSGPLKQMGTPTRPMTDEERKIFENLVNDSFTRFKDVVKSGRPALAADPALLDRVATGQVFTTDEALANGLVDKQGFIEEAIERAIVLAKLRRDKVQAVKYKKPSSLFAAPFMADSRKAPDLSALLDLASPRAYYLCTWLPSALAGP